MDEYIFIHLSTRPAAMPPPGPRASLCQCALGRLVLKSTRLLASAKSFEAAARRRTTAVAEVGGGVPTPWPC
jgi:hypothetical protein